MRLARLAHYAVHPSEAFDRAVYEVYARRRKRGMSRFINANPDAIVLASYPKSGNTLFRLIWLGLLKAQGEINAELDYEVLDALLPNDQFLADLETRWRFKSLPCLLKTHLEPRAEYCSQRLIHLVRNPLDTMVSNFHYFSARKGGPEGEKFGFVERRIFDRLPRNELGFSDFLREQFPYYVRHLDAWLKVPALPTSYEALTGENAAEEMRDVLSQLKLPVAEEAVDSAFREARPQKMREKPPSASMARLDGMAFARDARTGQWVEMFSRGDLDFVQQNLAARGWSGTESFPDRYQPIISCWPAECFSRSGDTPYDER